MNEIVKRIVNDSRRLSHCVYFLGWGVLAVATIVAMLGLSWWGEQLGQVALACMLMALVLRSKPS